MSKEDNYDSKEGGRSSSRSSIPDAVEVANLQEGYNQTYVILRNDLDTDEKMAQPRDSTVHDVFFRCGNWCYKGPIDFLGMSLDLQSLPTIIPCLQRQQASLRYYCTSKR